MTTPGRQLLNEPPSQWVALHAQRWPDNRREFEEAIGRLLARALSGDRILTWSESDPGQPVTVQLLDVPESDRTTFAYLAPPAAREDGTLPNKGLDLRSVVLTSAVRQNSTWVMNQAPARVHTRLVNVDAMVCALVIAPIMADLAGILILRAGEGGSNHKARLERLTRCKQVHEALGISIDHIDRLLDPSLTRHQVVDGRRRLIESWADHAEDVGARALSVLCVRLADIYYRRARKDGTIERARVITSTSGPLLDATLRDWSTFVAYLGEQLATADASPVRISPTHLPEKPPGSIEQRIVAARDWWEALHAHISSYNQGAGSLVHLLPRQWGAEEARQAHAVAADDDAPEETPRGFRDVLSGELVDTIANLWAFTVSPRQPSTLITQTRPFSTFRQILSPAIELWDEVFATCWDLSFENHARRTLDELETSQQRHRRELERLGSPVDESLYRGLIAAGNGHDWLFERFVPTLTFSISVSETGQPKVESQWREIDRDVRVPVFEALRDVLSGELRRWLDLHIDRFLDNKWRLDLTTAADAYWTRYRGRGKAPTLKQALPDVLPTAERWFAADYGALARYVGLDGPITESPKPSERILPRDLPDIRSEVAAQLRQFARPRDTDERQLAYRLDEIAAKADNVLTYWQAFGTPPPRTATVVDQWTADRIFKADPDTAYKHFLDALTAALRRRGHPAAEELAIPVA
jgi:hypothetical protein